MVRDYGIEGERGEGRLVTKNQEREGEREGMEE